MNRLFDGRPMRINNQMIPMTPGTALLNVAPYPQWYQPLPNWQYASGFNLGSLNCGPSWLGWGWPSWCGPAPAGFFCGTDYGPTPYIYFPAAGQWREAGVFGWVDGPDEDYTGPISVEVVEPVEIPVGFNPYGGPGMEVINQVFMYDAYYFPDAGRWGYMDRHGYFIWLNI
jgi:hypothetical protein